MADEHQRYERLAVGHVVGGLDDVDAARFRSHLVSCRACRTRVAELRGIASDLVATEREERAARATTGGTETEVAERVEEQAPPRADEVAASAAWPWRILAVGLAPLLVLGVLAWGVWTRAEAQVRDAALVTSTTALRTIAEGRPVPLEVDPAATDVSGTVAVTGAEVAVALAGLPELGPDEEVRVAVRDADGNLVETGTSFRAGQLRDAWLYDVVDRGEDGSRVVVEVLRYEDQQLVPSPVLELATAELDRGP